jgi:hypothetical protein
MAYKGEVTVQSPQGGVTSQLLAFNTFETGNFTFEAENWNFDGGDFIDGARPGFSGDTYFAKGENQDSEGIDFHELSDEFDPENVDPWRFPIANMPNTQPNSNEADREDYEDDPDADFSVTNTQPGEWMNYTRNFNLDDVNLWVRGDLGHDTWEGTGFSKIQLDLVTSDPSKANQTIEQLGVFHGSVGGYDWTPLVDDNGQIKQLSLGGKKTLRATVLSGNPAINYFMVVPAVELPVQPSEPASVGISHIGGRISIMWEGSVLEQAISVLGPWSPVNGAAKPHAVDANTGQAFFRAR